MYLGGVLNKKDSAKSSWSENSVILLKHCNPCIPLICRVLCGTRHNITKIVLYFGSKITHRTEDIWTDSSNSLFSKPSSLTILYATPQKLRGILFFSKLYRLLAKLYCIVIQWTLNYSKCAQVHDFFSLTSNWKSLLQRLPLFVRVFHFLFYFWAHRVGGKRGEHMSETIISVLNLSYK